MTRNVQELSPKQAEVVNRARRLESYRERLEDAARETAEFLGRLAEISDPDMETETVYTTAQAMREADRRTDRKQEEALDILRTLAFAGHFQTLLLEALAEGKEETP